jgi:hypothetical protein
MLLRIEWSRNPQRQHAHIHNGAAQRRAPRIDRKAVLDLVLDLMARLDR